MSCSLTRCSLARKCSVIVGYMLSILGVPAAALVVTCVCGGVGPGACTPVVSILLSQLSCKFSSEGLREERKKKIRISRGCKGANESTVSATTANSAGAPPRSPAPVSTEDRSGVGGSSDGQDEQK